ncbi:MAG TPA: hypothetical protein ACFYD2_00455, partial [Candidatus Avalokitesvara rifleensis]|uniref:hypothetical protein n=1 Tax=Candidatus Avalokitesvara rifleensis TaxID=3367620 RepID=UPI004029BB62
MRFIRPLGAMLILSLLVGLPGGTLAVAEEGYKLPQPASQEKLNELYDNDTLKKWFEEYVG